MIALDNGDKIRGDAAAATVVDYLIFGFVGTTATQIADGQLASSIGDLYTAGADGIGVSSIVLVNTDSSARAVNLYVTPSGGTARRLIAKDYSLPVGYSLYTDGKQTKAFPSASDHNPVTVAGAPLTLSTQEVTFNYDTGDFQLSGNDLQVKAASDTVAGKIEIATAAETTTGTDATRAISPDGLAGSEYGERAFQAVVFDFTTTVATGDGKFYFHIDSRVGGMNLVDVHAEVITAGTTNTTDIQIHNVTQTADMLSTVLTIDTGETGSDTAATPAVIDTGNDDVAENDVLRIDVDAVSTTAPQGLIVTLGFRLP